MGKNKECNEIIHVLVTPNGQRIEEDDDEEEEKEDEQQSSPRKNKKKTNFVGTV